MPVNKYTNGKKYNEVKNENNTDKVKKLIEELDEELDELYKMRTVLNSLKVIFNYAETGEPYGESEIY